MGKGVNTSAGRAPIENAGGSRARNTRRAAGTPLAAAAAVAAAIIQ